MGKASYLFGIFPYCNRSNSNSGKLDFMDVMRAILDGIAIAAHEQMTKKEKKINHILTIIICGICFIYSTASILHTGIAGFWNLFFDGIQQEEYCMAAVASNHTIFFIMI